MSTLFISKRRQESIESLPHLCLCHILLGPKKFSASVILHQAVRLIIQMGLTKWLERDGLDQPPHAGVFMSFPQDLSFFIQAKRQ